MKYRMYVDEVGNSDLKASADPNHQYLSLTGVILSLEHVDRVVFPSMEELKRRFFGSHPDDPIILHRKELIGKNYPFHSLRDPKVESLFNDALLGFLNEFDYVVITVVIDKLEHLQKYQVWRFDPYHYCLTVLVERYVLWLRDAGAKGDVLAESRGRHEDRRLKDSFAKVYTTGSDFISPDIFAAYLTSGELKVKTKANNIAGLQLADLIAHPSFRAFQAKRESRPLPGNFGGKIAEILETSKYKRSASGKIDGYGRKWLP